MRLPAVLALLCVAAAGGLLWWLPGRADGPVLPRVSARPPGEPLYARSAAGESERRPTAQPEPARPDPPQSLPASNTSLEQCLALAGSEERRVCLETAFAQLPELDEVAAWLCSTARPLALQMEVLAAMVRRLEPAEAWTWLDGLQARCARHRETHLFKGALVLAGQSDPSWLMGFEQALSPEVLFSAELGEAPVQVAVMLAQQGSEFARFVLERGGCGDFGGSARQIDRAASCSLALQSPGEEFYRYLCEVAKSPNLPEDSGLGSTLATFLTDPRARPDGDPLAPLLQLSSVLTDRRLNQSAALTLLQQVGPTAPVGVDDAVWNGLLAQARSVLPAALHH
ncbi:MAG: hypothetical protein FJ299_15865 [Planctomycetes bacterium]|nr:hypothetical protein [Planctomycetota bacterium]